MTELLLAKGTPQRVLEIGTGCGYQTAVLAQLVPKVFTVERIQPLLDRAKQRFTQLNLRHVRATHADGSLGWPQKGPYDAILSAAAPYSVPDELLAQLAPDGILVIPVGGDEEQELQVITRKGDSKHFDVQNIEPVRFVPLLSGVKRGSQ